MSIGERIKARERAERTTEAIAIAVEQITCAWCGKVHIHPRNLEWTRAAMREGRRTFERESTFEPWFESAVIGAF